MVRADLDYYTLFMVENTFTTRLTGSNDDECATVLSVLKLWNGESRFVIFIPQFSILGSVVVHEEQLYIKVLNNFSYASLLMMIVTITDQF